MRLTRLILVVTAGVLLTGGAAQAELYTGSGIGENDIYVRGSYGEFWITGNSASAYVAATVNPVTPSLTYNAITFSTPTITKTFTKSFTVGLGNTVPVSLTITFDATTISLTNVGPLSLTPLTNGVYDVQDIFYPSTWDFTQTGSYALAGPTQTITGTFSKERTVSIGQPSQANWDLDTSGYPSDVALTESSSSVSPYFLIQWVSLDSPHLVDATVDGVNITFYSGGNYYMFDHNIILANVPEPASLSLLALGGLAMLRRRSSYPKS